MIQQNSLIFIYDASHTPLNNFPSVSYEKIISISCISNFLEVIILVSIFGFWLMAMAENFPLNLWIIGKLVIWKEKTGWGDLVLGQIWI